MTNSIIIEKLLLLNTNVNNFKKYFKTKYFTKEEIIFIKDSKTLEKDVIKFFIKKAKESKFKTDSGIANKLKISLKKYYSFLELGEKIAQCFDAGYSMGGIINVYVKHGENNVLVGTKNTKQEYSKSSKFKAIHGYNEIIISKKHFEKLEIIGGVPTIKLENSKISKCLMLIGKGHKNKYQILFKEGFITSTYHSDTFDGCENWRKDEYLRKIKERIFVNENRNVLTKFIGLKHSLKVGNCEIGTKMFAQKHNLDVNNGYRLDYLLSLEPNNIFVNKLIKSLHY
jgi:hypothetical protein